MIVFRSSGSLHPFDPEIEKTLNRIRKSKNMHIGHNSSSNVSSINVTDDFEIKPNFADNPLYEPDPIENNNNRMLKELVTLDLEPAQTYELKFGLIHLLPKFHGLVGEDSYKHLKEFHVVCSTMRPDKRLVVSIAGDVHYVEENEENVPREVLLGIQNSGHPEGDLWNLATLRGNVTPVLGKV
ncbi:hypothetical protein CR513_07608, partial [Mucuna pruriens]